MALEDTMAQLAHSQVSQSLPSLANDVQGFQIIESNEDINSAIGVLVALIGNLVDYIPAIFRKGKIYNMDIMYIPELHQWLPTQDNWVTYLKSRRADIEAMVMDKGSAGAGKAGAVNLDIPLLKIIKTASERLDKKYIDRVGIPTALKEAGETIHALWKEGSAEISGIPSAIELLKKCAASPEAQRIVNTISRHSDVADAFVQFYKDDELLDVATTVVNALKETQSPKPATTGEVKVLTSASKEARTLSDVEKAEILRDGAVIVDTRGITPTRIYKTNKSSNAWGSPSLNGVYELLQLDGTTVTAYVVVGARNLTGNDNFNYVIPLDDNMTRKVTKVPAQILGQSLPLRQFNLTGGYGVDNIPTGKFDTYLFIDIDGTALEVQNFKPSYLSANGEVVIQTSGARVHIPNDTRSAWTNTPTYYSGCDKFDTRINQIVKIPSGGRMRVKGSTLFVPEKCRIFEIGHQSLDTSPICCGPSEDTSNTVNRQRKLALATMDEFVDAVSRREKLLNIKIYNDTVGYVISDDTGKATDPLNKRAAALELVKTYVIPPDTAKEMLNEVPLRSHNRYLAKMAADANYMMAFSENDPTNPDVSSVDLNGEIGAEERRLIQQAADTGVKEVMDVTVLKLLAEDGSSVRMIQDMIPQLFSAMNAVGQILFMLRASVSMSEAYGEYRADEMEKQFTKLMQRLGDAVIVLQQGRIDDVKDLLEGPLSSTLG